MRRPGRVESNPMLPAGSSERKKTAGRTVPPQVAPWATIPYRQQPCCLTDTPPRPPGFPLMPKKSSGRTRQPKVTGIVGLGLDGKDGHRRVTRTEQLVLVGGS